MLQVLQFGRFPNPDSERYTSFNLQASWIFGLASPIFYPMFESITDPRQRAFLIGLARFSGHHANAARFAGVSKDRWLSPDWARDPAFQEAYDLAMQICQQDIADEITQRAIAGSRSYKFTKDGDPIMHPTLCECGREKRDHVRLESGAYGPCIDPDSNCSGFEPTPYYELQKSDTLLAKLAQAKLPEQFGQRVHLTGALASLDLSKLPDHALNAILNGENPATVLAGLVEKSLPPASSDL